MCRRFHCPFPSVLFAALSVRLLVNLALDPGAGKWGIPDQEGHLAPADGGARSLVCCHVQRLILARRHYILVHLWIGSLVKCRNAGSPQVRSSDGSTPQSPTLDTRLSPPIRECRSAASRTQVNTANARIRHPEGREHQKRAGQRISETTRRVRRRANDMQLFSEHARPLLSPQNEDVFNDQRC